VYPPPKKLQYFTVDCRMSNAALTLSLFRCATRKETQLSLSSNAMDTTTAQLSTTTAFMVSLHYSPRDSTTQSNDAAILAQSFGR